VWSALVLQRRQLGNQVSLLISAGMSHVTRNSGLDIASDDASLRLEEHGKVSYDAKRDQWQVRFPNNVIIGRVHLCVI
jgi:hypothetical protein